MTVVLINILIVEDSVVATAVRLIMNVHYWKSETQETKETHQVVITKVR